MVGITEIASYIPENRISNYDRKEEFGIDDYFIEEKIGIKQVAQKESGEQASDMCVRALERLSAKTNINKSEIEVLIVVTQNPDQNIPHTSAIVHGKLGLDDKCAAFDISLGCSGYIYGLSIIQSFMEANGFTKGLLFTADPYSVIIDEKDKNTSLLFGDAATVTLISDKPAYSTGQFTFGTSGKDSQALSCADKKLYMNGRAVFNFSAKCVPGDIKAMLTKNDLSIDDVDLFVFHQGSKFIVDTITKRLNLDPGKVVFDAHDYGNTVSSSIPILLEKEVDKKDSQLIVLSGFGVGLSWSSVVLKKTQEGLH